MASTAQITAATAHVRYTTTVLRVQVQGKSRDQALGGEGYAHLLAAEAVRPRSVGMHVYGVLCRVAHRVAHSMHHT